MLDESFEPGPKVKIGDRHDFLHEERDGSAVTIVVNGSRDTRDSSDLTIAGENPCGASQDLVDQVVHRVTHQDGEASTLYSRDHTAAWNSRDHIAARAYHTATSRTDHHQ